MTARTLLATCAAAAALIAIGQLTAVARPGLGETRADRGHGPAPAAGVALGRGSIGPDVIVSDLPDTRLIHNGGDICIGEQIYQSGFKMKQFNESKQYIHTSAAPRRGYREKFPWYK